MRAALFESFQKGLRVCNVDAPKSHPDSVIIKVEACGICRSDWHGWMGHDSDVQLPHVPGHELAGVVEETGNSVRNFGSGQRVTVPFCCGCGTCIQCVGGNQQICDRYTQPGFTQWGAFAEYVEIRHADVNLVALPDSLSSVTAASLGCRFATSFRAIVFQGDVTAGDIVAIHGCGGVGLSAVMIASALGARVVAVDIDEAKLMFAKQCGADITLNAAECDNIAQAIIELTGGRGASMSMDALGSRTTCYNSVACLAKQGSHVQVGLTLGTDADPPIPMSLVIGKELKIIGSHGMQAFKYPLMLRMIESRRLSPEKLIQRLATLDEACSILPKMNSFPCQGVIVIDLF